MSKYPTHYEKPIIHPRVGLSAKSLKENAEQFLMDEIKKYVNEQYHKFTKVKFTLIFTPSEFAIAAYRNAGSKGFFSKACIRTYSKSYIGLKENKVTQNDDSDPTEHVNIHTTLNLLDSMIIIFKLFGGVLPVDFRDIIK